MADFAIGVAGGILIETIKAIWTLREQVVENQEESNRLAEECKETHKLLKELLDTTLKSRPKDDPIFNIVRSHMTEFQITLDDIKKAMENWAAKERIKRVLKVRKMSRIIEEHLNKVVAMWRKINFLLQIQILAQNADITETLCVMKETAVRTHFETAKQLDNQATEEHVRVLNAALSVATSNIRADISSLGVLVQKGFASASKERNQLFSELKSDLNPAGSIQDSLAQAQNELMQMIYVYDGNRPLFNIDSSELPLPTEGLQAQVATIYRATYRQNKIVAVKKVRIFPALGVIDWETYFERIDREMKIWRDLKHPNVVEFIGCRGPLGFLVSEWISNGNVRQYVANTPNVDYIKLCLDIVNGLAYIHSLAQPVTHGGLKGSNILVDHNGLAKLGDFSLSLVEVDTGSRQAPVSWSAPEVLDGFPRTPRSDMYSFACVMLEIFTGKDPFPTKWHQVLLDKNIRNGLRPEFPWLSLSIQRGLTGPDHPLWGLIQDCWLKLDPTNGLDRPGATEARSRLEDIWANTL